MDVESVGQLVGLSMGWLLLVIQNNIKCVYGAYILWEAVDFHYHLPTSSYCVVGYACKGRRCTQLLEIIKYCENNRKRHLTFPPKTSFAKRAAAKTRTKDFTKYLSILFMGYCMRSQTFTHVGKSIACSEVCKKSGGNLMQTT